MSDLNLFSFLDSQFHAALQNGVADAVQQGLQASRGWLRAAVAIWILTTAGMALFGGLGVSRLVQRTLRAVIISLLITQPELYTRFVVQPIVTGWPAILAQAFGGPAAIDIPQQFSAMGTTIGNLGAAAREQAGGISYIGQYVMIWVAEFSARGMLIPEFVLYEILQLFTALTVIAGTLVLIFFMFDTTKGFAESWLGTVVGCLVTLALMSAVMSMVIKMDATYMARIAAMPHIQAQPVTILGVDLGTTGGAAVNMAEAITVLFNIGMLGVVGIFELIIAFVIGFAIGRGASLRVNGMVAGALRMARGGF